MKKQGDALDWLSGGGEMGALIRAHSWADTPVGLPETWPQSLRTALSICLGTKFPMFVWWGKDLTVFYNDGYIPFTGLKHPAYLGKPAREQWAEVWNELQPLTDQVIKTGASTWAESMLLFMTRKDFLEETYFTFSYSPIRDESGGVGGIINPCQETTKRVLGERRLKTLHDLGVMEIKQLAEVGPRVAEVLAKNPRDIPFALIYLTRPDAKSVDLVGSFGMDVESGVVPKQFTLASFSSEIWPFSRVFQSRRAERIAGLRLQCEKTLPEMPYPEKPDVAWVAPIEVMGHDVPVGLLVLGCSARLAFDESYQDFFLLVSQHIANHFSSVKALEDEKKRVEALAEIDRAKTEFFSNVSHEFRTPLTLMIGPVEALLSGAKGTLSPELEAEVEVVHRNALRLLKLVNSLLDFSRIEAGRAQVDFQACDLTKMTVDIASTFRSAIESAGLAFHVTCEKMMDPIFVDREMWEKIVLNLLSNAFKYTLKGEIQISLQSKNDVVELCVKDTGVGIPKSDITKIFQRFHRVQGVSGRTHEGSGIGLALVQELVKLHGGSIEAKSVLNEGSTFFVRIPKGANIVSEKKAKDSVVSTAIGSHAFVEEAARWSAQPTKVQADTTEESVESKQKIVLADDNADMREYVQRLLTPQYEVIAVSDGKQALEVINATQPDLVLSDIMMPVMDGLALLQTLRSNPKFRTIPVILLSARAGEDAKTSGVATGADDYITKPFSAKELQARVQTHLSLSRFREKLLRQLEYANKELEAFSYSVAHDLRAPLRSVTGFSNLLLDDYSSVLDEKGNDYLQRIRFAAAKMGQLMDGLLTLSRLSRSDMKETEVDLSDLANEVMTELKNSEPERKVDWIIAKNMKVRGDIRLFQVALQNLLGNAWKFTSRNKQARIQVGEKKIDGKLTYFVQDNGAGFDMQYAEKLFGVFNRLHSEEEFKGTGIGLATVRRVIQRHGGVIWADAKPGEGATFYFQLTQTANQNDKSIPA